MPKRLAVPVLLVALLAGCAKKVQTAARQPLTTVATPRNWVEVSVPFKPTNISASGGTFWLCGPDEIIASSSDGGATWKVRHHHRGGKTLLNIGFSNEKVGHAGGEDGLLLSTADGGRTWRAHRAGSDAVQAVSFADALHGIAVLTNHTEAPEVGTLGEVQGVPLLESDVKLTRDGGQRWEDITAMKTDDQLRLYTEVLSVAALDPDHYVIGVRQPQIAVGYAVTQDAGKTWKLVQVDNVYATKVFVHNGEYWTFGIEYLDRQNHGGYSAPVSLHSKDGLAWIHGVRGPNEFPTCNAQGCYLWNGVVEDLYGEHEKFWALPEDGTMGKAWAMAGSRVCTIAVNLQCGPAALTDSPPPRPVPYR